MVAAANSEKDQVDDLLESEGLPAKEEHGNEDQVQDQEKNMTPEAPEEP